MASPETVSAVLKGIDNAKGLQEPSQSCSGLTWTDVSPWASAIGEKRKESVPQLWTAQVFAPPAQLHIRRIIPLPAGRFLRLSSRTQTSSPSRQITDWAPCPCDEVGVPFIIGSA